MMDTYKNPVYQEQKYGKKLEEAEVNKILEGDEWVKQIPLDQLDDEDLEEPKDKDFEDEDDELDSEDDFRKSFGKEEKKTETLEEEEDDWEWDDEEEEDDKKSEPEFKIPEIPISTREKIEDAMSSISEEDIMPETRPRIKLIAEKVEPQKPKIKFNKPPESTN